MQSPKKENSQYTPDELATLETCLNFYKQLYPTPTELQSQMVSFIFKDLSQEMDLNDAPLNFVRLTAFILSLVEREPLATDREPYYVAARMLLNINGYLQDLKALKLVP